MPLNKGGEGELTGNFLEYREADDDGDVKLRFSRVTDLEVPVSSDFFQNRVRRPLGTLYWLVPPDFHANPGILPEK